MSKSLDVIVSKGCDVTEILKKLIKKGNVTKIVVKDSSGDILVQLPLTVMGAGFLISPFLAGAAVVLAYVRECTIEVEKESGVDVNSILTSGSDDSDKGLG